MALKTPTVQRVESRLRLLRPRRRWLAYLAMFGPGLIAANAGNDAGGIATYANVGAQLGYGLLWAFIPVALALGFVQEMCARIGAVTGKGLADLIRENFGVRWTMLAMLALLIANGAIVVSEFAGIAAASDLLGISRYISVPLTAGTLWWLIVKGSYSRVERLFVALSLAFLSYIISAFLAKPDWGEVGLSLVQPSFQLDPNYLFIFVATIGTTISPYMQLFITSSVVEKGVSPKTYGPQRADVLVSTAFAMLTVFFIVVATAATLHKNGVTSIDNAEQAAMALEPFAGSLAKYLFAFGLFGASVLAAGVLPLATAYSISEAFGFEKGISHSFADAPVFMGLFTSLLFGGALVALIPGLPLFQLLLVTQVLNALALPVLLIFILRLVNSKKLMNRYVNTPIMNVIAWLMTAIISVLSISLVVITLLQQVGVIGG
jgi:NRAMP (natural resistance-associated macrophage protein)-like metal ion transporter